jgi:hypothetical protein
VRLLELRSVQAAVRHRIPHWEDLRDETGDAAEDSGPDMRDLYEDRY